MSSYLDLVLNKDDDDKNPESSDKPVGETKTEQLPVPIPVDEGEGPSSKGKGKPKAASTAAAADSASKESASIELPPGHQLTETLSTLQENVAIILLRRLCTHREPSGTTRLDTTAMGLRAWMCKHMWLWIQAYLLRKKLREGKSKGSKSDADSQKFFKDVDHFMRRRKVSTIIKKGKLKELAGEMNIQPDQWKTDLREYLKDKLGNVHDIGFTLTKEDVERGITALNSEVAEISELLQLQNFTVNTIVPYNKLQPLSYDRLKTMIQSEVLLKAEENGKLGTRNLKREEEAEYLKLTFIGFAWPYILNKLFEQAKEQRGPEASNKAEFTSIHRTMTFYLVTKATAHCRSVERLKLHENGERLVRKAQEEVEEQLRSGDCLCLDQETIDEIKKIIVVKARKQKTNEHGSTGEMSSASGTL